MDAEQRLLSAARRMNKRALADIFDLHARSLYKYALRYCRDPYLADQIVGDVFARLLEQLAAGRGPQQNLRSYLFEIAFNLVIDEGRYVSRRAAIERVDMEGPYKRSIQVDVDEQLEFERISRSIMSLSADQRHVIILRFLEGFSISETALILKKSVPWVKVTQFRAIWRLRLLLETKPTMTSQTFVSNGND